MLHEIHDACRDVVRMSCVSLDAKQVERVKIGYQIRMKCDLDKISRQCIENILKKRQLAMKEEKGFVVIFKTHLSD